MSGVIGQQIGEQKHQERKRETLSDVRRGNKPLVYFLRELAAFRRQARSRNQRDDSARKNTLCTHRVATLTTPMERKVAETRRRSKLMTEGPKYTRATTYTSRPRVLC